MLSYRQLRKILRHAVLKEQKDETWPSCTKSCVVRFTNVTTQQDEFRHLHKATPPKKSSFSHFDFPVNVTSQLHCWMLCICWWKCSKFFPCILLSHCWGAALRSNSAEMNAVILGGSSVYSKGNVRNRILQAAEEGKAILKSCLEWLMLLSCTNELLFLHLCTKKPILICLWLQEYNFLVIVRNMLNNTGNRNSILTTNGKGIKPVMWWIPQKYPQWCLAMENCICWICFSYKKMGLKYISFIHKGYFAVQHFYKIYSLKNYDLS